MAKTTVKSNGKVTLTLEGRPQDLLEFLRSFAVEASESVRTFQDDQIPVSNVFEAERADSEPKNGISDLFGSECVVTTDELPREAVTDGPVKDTPLISQMEGAATFDGVMTTTDDEETAPEAPIIEVSPIDVNPEQEKPEQEKPLPTREAVVAALREYGIWLQQAGQLEDGESARSYVVALLKRFGGVDHTTKLEGEALRSVLDAAVSRPSASELKDFI